jgi:hypothetical protein
VRNHTLLITVAAARSDTVRIFSYKFRACAALNRAWVGTGDIFFQLALAWNSGVRNHTMFIMVTAIWRGTIVRSWSTFKHGAIAAGNRASAYFGSRVARFFGHCGVAISLDAAYRYTLLTVTGLLAGLGGLSRILSGHGGG